jgi:hypothetical protein
MKILLAALLVMACSAVANAQTPQTLLGSWNYESMMNLKHGKPFGTLHFGPGQWIITFKSDGTWTRTAPLPPAKPQSGTYKVHKQTLILKYSVSVPDDRYRFEIQSDGKKLTMTDKKTIFQASRQPE